MKKYQDSGNKPKLSKKNADYHRKSENVEDKRYRNTREFMKSIADNLRSPRPSNPSKIKRR